MVMVMMIIHSFMMIMRFFLHLKSLCYSSVVRGHEVMMMPR